MRPWCRTKGGSYKEYIKNKPICWGIKVWVLCEAKRSYVCNFDIYLGKEEGNVEHNLAWRVVRKLLLLLIKNKYHHLYMDNLHFIELEQKKILACGTIRTDWKGFFNNIILTSAMERRMNHGDYAWRNHAGCHGMISMTVYLVFTIHPSESNGERAVVERHNAAGGREAIPCPPAQSAHQEFMVGVNLAEQILHSLEKNSFTMDWKFVCWILMLFTRK